MYKIILKSCKSRNAVSVLFLMMWFSSVVAPIVEVPAGTSSFIHFTHVGISTTSWVFYLKTENDGVLGLFENQDPSSLIYEIELGGNLNRNSYLRSNDNILQGNHTGAVVDKDTFFPFWLAWSSNFIMVGMGTEPGKNIMFSRSLIYPPTTSVHGQYLAVRSGNAAGYWMLVSTCAKRKF